MKIFCGLLLSCLLLENATSKKVQRRKGQMETPCNPQGLGLNFGGCPEGWHDAGVGYGCFKFFAKKKGFQGAQSQCRKKGGFLAQPRCKEQIDFLRGRALRRANSRGEWPSYYIGLTDVGHEGQWKWLSDKGKVKDSDWGKKKYNRQPDNKGGNQHCGQMSHKYNYRWDDIQCHKKQSFVCQRWRGISTVGRAAARP